MEKVSLLIDDDFIDEFMNSLPKDKIVVVEDSFNKNVELFNNNIDDYKNDKLELTSYYDSSKDLTVWFEERVK